MRDQSPDNSPEKIVNVTLEGLRARVNGRHEERVFRFPLDRERSPGAHAKTRKMMAVLHGHLSVSGPLNIN